MTEKAIDTLQVCLYQNQTLWVCDLIVNPEEPSNLCGFNSVFLNKGGYRQKSHNSPKRKSTRRNFS
jgi:hypothetical protein